MDPNINLTRQIELAARILSGTLAPYEMEEEQEGGVPSGAY